MAFVTFCLLGLGALFVAMGLNPFVETMRLRREKHLHADRNLGQRRVLPRERTGTFTFPTGIGLMVMALALSAIWGGIVGIRAYGAMLQFVALFFLGQWIWLRFSSGLGDRLNQKILAERMGHDNQDDPYALSYHHQKKFVSGFFTVIGFGALLFLLGTLLRTVG